MTLTLTPVSGLPLINTGDDLPALIHSVLPANGISLRDDDIMVVGQKIVSKAEGRTVDLSRIRVGKEASGLALKTGKDPRLVELILRESERVVRARQGTLIVQHKLGFVCANAGIDRSNVPSANAEELVLLLPREPDESAYRIRAGLQAASGCRLGVAIIDSHGRPWRLGTVGVCIGVSGIPPTIDQRGWSDLFGYELQSTVVAAIDELAAGASLVMGQASEGIPVVHVRGFPYPLREGSMNELIRPASLDLFR